MIANQHQHTPSNGFGQGRVGEIPRSGQRRFSPDGDADHRPLGDSADSISESVPTCQP